MTLMLQVHYLEPFFVFIAIFAASVKRERLLTIAGILFIFRQAFVSIRIMIAELLILLLQRGVILSTAAFEVLDIIKPVAVVQRCVELSIFISSIYRKFKLRTWSELQEKSSLTYFLLISAVYFITSAILFFVGSQRSGSLAFEILFLGWVSCLFLLNLQKERFSSNLREDYSRFLRSISFLVLVQIVSLGLYAFTRQSAFLFLILPAALTFIRWKPNA